MYFSTKLVIADIALKMNKYFIYINFTQFHSMKSKNESSLFLSLEIIIKEKGKKNQ